ncbi:MAG: ABC transporter permease [Candidatus Hodarchaeales archaeon]|jgi:ABC-2 type transport system permease protein
MRFAFLIAVRIWKQLSRDRRTVGLVVFAPILFIVLFGVAFGGEINNIPIIIVNNDSVAAIGDAIIENLEISEKVEVELSNDDFDNVMQLVDDKNYIGAILIPENFTYNLAFPGGENISVILYLDNSNPQVGVVALQAFQDAFQKAAGEFRSNFALELNYAYGEDLSTLDFFGPAMIVYGVFFFSFILVIMNLIEEKKGGTLPLLLQCPYDKLQIIAGYLIAFSIFSMFQTTIVILAAGILFNISFGSTILNYISLYIGAVIVGWTALILAIFLSSFARSEFQAVQFIPLVILPALMLSGIVIPLAQIPQEIRWVSYLLPTTYGVHLLRQISIEGYVLELFNIDIIAQVIFLLIFLVGARLTLKET